MASMAAMAATRRPSSLLNPNVGGTKSLTYLTTSHRILVAAAPDSSNRKTPSDPAHNMDASPSRSKDRSIEMCRGRKADLNLNKHGAQVSKKTNWQNLFDPRKLQTHNLLPQSRENGILLV
jgi:hypothetical protein